MSINPVHYWNSPDNQPLSIAGFSNNTKDVESYFEDYSQSFDSSLFDLLGQSNINSGSLYSNSFFGYDLNSPSQLRDASEKAKSMGMEKVLAAQLSSPLPFYSSNDRRDNNSSYDGLSSFTNLTIQLALAKAQKTFESIKQKETMSLQTYIKNISDFSTKETEEFFDENSSESSLHEAVDKLKNQIESTSKLFDVSFKDIVRIIDTYD